MKALIVGLVLAMAVLSQQVRADNYFANCTENCTYNLTIWQNVTFNVTTFANVTVIDASFVLNMTSTIGDLRANLTYCENRIENEIEQMRNTTGYQFLVGFLQNQTLGLVACQQDNAMLKANLTIASNYDSAIIACRSERDMYHNQSITCDNDWQRKYNKLENDYKNYAFIAIALIAVYVGRKEILGVLTHLGEREGERETGERDV